MNEAAKYVAELYEYSHSGNFYGNLHWMQSQCATNFIALQLASTGEIFGVTDGARTHDNQNHNLSTRANIHAGLGVILGISVHYRTTAPCGLPAHRSHESTRL